MSKIVKVDVDGVIRDMIGGMCQIYQWQFKEHISPESITDYDINKSFPKVKEQLNCTPWQFFFEDHADGVFRCISKPFDGVKQALDLLHKKGYKVVIVTWQFNKQNKEFTLDFFDRHHLYYDDICFTQDKWMVHGDYLIDDNPEFILNESDHSKKIMVDTPYNRYIDDKSLNILRVKSLEEAVDVIVQHKF